ncbi:MAG: hypothetical protein Tsb0020_31490 [Haliangiales bacterium]
MSFVFNGTERFQILRQLGAGGMGVVYEALDRETKTHVALKTLRILNGESLLRFKNEFRSLQGLQHDNLVNLGELFEDAGHWFFTMELIEGEDFLSYVGRGRSDGLESSAATLVQTRPFGAATTVTTSFDDFLGPHASFDVNEERLRDALAQLVCGLRALHSAHKVHRDVKPSNCLVTREGRVVVLDFGLISDRTMSQPWHNERDLVGTVPYMAPEQAAAKPAQPPADMYSVGVVLYEALTGLVPFAGPPGLVVQLKQSELPPSPRQLASEVPIDLDALCMDLLQIEPSARLTSDQVLERLGYVERRSRRSVSSVPGPLRAGDSAFVGRTRELSALNAAYEKSRQHAISLLVSGESGVGKSALLAHWNATLDHLEPRPLTLIGRCHEREAVPYKAFDGIIDALSYYLEHIFAEDGGPDADDILPQHASLLLQVFPVLERVRAIANAPRVVREIRDPQERRRLIFEAVRELFTNLAKTRPLVIEIEDIQWSDADSAALLNALLHPPAAPRLLLITTLRTPSEGALPQARPTLPASRPALSLSPLMPLPGDDVRYISLPRLTREEAHALATQLMPAGAGWGAELLDTLAAESEGHPLFLDELLRHVDSASMPDSAQFQLEDALWARIEELEPAYQRLLRVVCAAGRPLEQSVAAAVAGLPSADMPLVIRTLEVAKLVRTTGPRIGDAIEPYHDRVRGAVVAHYTPDTHRVLHVAIAEALEDAKASPEALSFHWGEAAHIERAARYAITAAVDAAKALAFERAAHFYRRAIEFGCLPDKQVRRLYIGLGDALVNAGRGDEAAEAYLSAAARSETNAALELKRRAVEHRLRSGHIRSALDTLHELLEEFGFRLPGSQGAAKLSLVTQRSLLALRGTKFRERSADELPVRTLMKIDLCWSVAAGIALADPIVGASFITRNLRLSLAAGEPYRLSRALSLYSMAISALDSRNAPRAAELREIALDLAHKSKNPHAIALAIMADGWSLYWRGQWKRAFEVLDRADEMFRTQCQNLEGSPTSRLFALYSLYYLGDIPELRHRQPQLLRQAHERGDLQAAVNLGTGISHLVALAEDDPERARTIVSEHMALWRGENFYLQHWSTFMAQCEIDLYCRDWRAALDRLEETRPAVNASVIARNQKMRQDDLLLQVRCGVAAARAEPARRREHLRRVERAARRVEQDVMPWSAPLVMLGRAAMAALEGKRADAAEVLTEAIAAFEHADMALHADIARYRLGRLQDTDDGRALATAAHDALAERGIRRPEAFIDCVAPGFEA